MSTRDIQEQIKDLYDINISSELVSKISEKIMCDEKMRQSQILCKVSCLNLQDGI